MPSPLPDSPALIRDETGAQRLLGYVVDLRDGRARSHLDLGPQHGNRHGGLHGGIIACLLDNAMGFAAAQAIDPDGGARVFTVSMNTQFLAQAREGRVTAEGVVTGGGKSLKFVEGRLTDENGTLLATASGVFKRARS